MGVFPSESGGSLCFCSSHKFLSCTKTSSSSKAPSISPAKNLFLKPLRIDVFGTISCSGFWKSFFLLEWKNHSFFSTNVSLQVGRKRVFSPEGNVELCWLNLSNFLLEHSEAACKNSQDSNIVLPVIFFPWPKAAKLTFFPSAAVFFSFFLFINWLSPSVKSGRDHISDLYIPVSENFFSHWSQSKHEKEELFRDDFHDGERKKEVVVAGHVAILFWLPHSGPISVCSENF